MTQDANAENGFVDRDEQDLGGWAQYDYRPNDEHLVSAFAYYYGDEFDMNDMGFLKRNDWLRLVFMYQRDYTSHPDSDWLRSSYWRIKPSYEENNDGFTLQSSVDLSYFWKLENTQEYSLQAHIEVEDPWDDRITRGNGLVRLDPQHSFEAKFLNRRGGDLTFSLAYVAENKGTDKLGHELIFEPQWYVADRVTISAEASYQDNSEWLLWDFDTQQLATYDADVFDVNLRLDVYPSSRQEVRVKLQLVAARADAISGQQIGSDGRLSPSNVPVSDFSLSDTALQIRYRYQLAPLSDIFLVYERGGFYEDDRNESSPGDLFDRAWKDVTGQRVLAKIRYRF